MLAQWAKVKERAIDWHRNVQNRIENSEMTTLKKHIRCEINLEQSSTDRIRRWIWNAKEIEQSGKNTTKWYKKIFCNMRFENHMN